MSPKQTIYRELFRLVLPTIRNTQSHGPWHKAWDRSSYLLAELIHNLYYSMFEPEFGDHDVWFMNHQARAFVERASTRTCYPYELICDVLADLFEAAPEGVRSRLEWRGPTRRSPKPRPVDLEA